MNGVVMEIRELCFCVYDSMSQVSAQDFPDTRSDAQTFTIGVMPQTPGLPQLSPGADLQINVTDTITNHVFSYEVTLTALFASTIAFEIKGQL